MDMSLNKLQEMVKPSGKPDVLQSMGLQRVRHDLATEQQQIAEILETLDFLENQTALVYKEKKGSLVSIDIK